MEWNDFYKEIVITACYRTQAISERPEKFPNLKDLNADYIVIMLHSH